MDPIVIVGGGIVGTTLAYFLRDSPTDVVLLEQDSLGAGSTGDSMSVFAWHLNLEAPYLDVCRRAWDIYEAPLNDGFLNYHRGGFLVVAHEQEYLDELETTVAAYDQPGVDATANVLTPDETAQYGLNPEGVGAGALYVDEGRFTDDPGYKIVTYFADRASNAGVDVRERVRVTDIETNNQGVTGVRTSAGTIDAGTVVNAAGPWSPKLNEMAGESLPLKHTPAPMIQYELDREIGINEESPLSLLTFPDGLYVVGGYPRTAYVGNAPHEGAESHFEDAVTFDAEQEFNSRIDHRFRHTVADRINSTIPWMQRGTVVDEWKCLRTVTPDHFPLVGPTSLDGYCVATGMSGQGITIAPATSELLAEYVLTGEVPSELAAFDPNRFDT